MIQCSLVLAASSGRVAAVGGGGQGGGSGLHAQERGRLEGDKKGKYVTFQHLLPLTVLLYY